MQKSTDSMTIR